MYVRSVIRRDAPRGQLSEDFRGVAKTEIEDIVLGNVGAINIVDWPPSHVLPIEVEEEACEYRQTVLRKDIRFVMRDADEVLVIGRCDTGVRQVWIQRDQTACHH